MDRIYTNSKESPVCLLLVHRCKFTLLEQNSPNLLAIEQDVQGVGLDRPCLTDLVSYLIPSCALWHLCMFLSLRWRFSVVDQPKSHVFEDTEEEIFFILFSFLLFRATPRAYGGSQARALIRAIAACLHHSHSNTGSEPHL